MTESFMNIQWAFNEITWRGGGEYRKPHVGLFLRRSKEFFEKFGPTVEKLVMSQIEIGKSALLKVLSLMPNLINLSLDYCSILELFQPTAVLSLPNLIKIWVQNCWTQPSANELLESILCPSIRALHLRDASQLGPKFFRRHNYLKEISIQYCRRLYDDKKLFGQLFQLKLTTLSLELDMDIEASEVDALIESQPLLTSLALSLNNRRQVELVLGQIAKLRNLESLQFHIWSDYFESVPEQLVHGIMRTPKLKKLDIEAYNDNIMKGIFSAKNMQLESLTIFYSENLREKFQQLPSIFPNLKSLEIKGLFKGDPNCFARLKKLESLDIRIDEFSDDEIEVSESVCELKACMCLLPRLFRMMPNIERLEIRNCNRHWSGIPKGASMKDFFDEVLSLKNLVELECDSEILIHDEVINCINNRNETSKLGRIIFYFESRRSQTIVEAYGEQFPCKHVGFETGKITLSRY